jgi:Fe-S cluster biogenesis protein NfuA
MDQHADKDTPPEHPPPSLAEVEMQIDRIRPGLIADGGNIEIAGLDPDGTLRVVMQGECASCPAQIATLRIAIEAPLRRALNGIRTVVAV